MSTEENARVTAPVGELDTCRVHAGFWFECQHQHPGTTLASPLDGLSPEAVTVFRWLGNHPQADVFLSGDDAIASDVKRAHRLAEAVLAAHTDQHLGGPLVVAPRMELTDTEVDYALALDGFDPRETYPEYGHDSLRTAYRSGMDDAGQTPEPVTREQVVTFALLIREASTLGDAAAHIEGNFLAHGVRVEQATDRG